MTQALGGAQVCPRALEPPKRQVWGWVLCYHEPRELGDGFMVGPNGIGV